MLTARNPISSASTSRVMLAGPRWGWIVRGGVCFWMGAIPLMRSSELGTWWKRRNEWWRTIFDDGESSLKGGVWTMIKDSVVLHFLKATYQFRRATFDWYKIHLIIEGSAQAVHSLHSVLLGLELCLG